MQYLVGDHVVQRLTEWNVTRGFGYPETASTVSWEFLHRHSHLIDFVQVRHEAFFDAMLKGDSEAADLLWTARQLTT